MYLCRMGILSILSGGIALLGLATAQYFPPTPEEVTVLHSKFDPKITISYKEPHICETTEGVKSYSGYVNLPPNTLSDVDVFQPYNISYFFWYFEARKDPNNAPTSIWLNGGPGSSSMIGLLSENGPCSINHDSNSTTINPWSWNNEVNMLYIDQPVQTGFSYDTPTNGTLDLQTGEVTKQDFSKEIPEANNTFLVGTFSGQDQYSTANDTVNGARALWHFAQTWFGEFPVYKPNDDKVSIWTESYGGRYGPAYTAFFQEQNEKIRNGTLTKHPDLDGDGQSDDAHYIHLDTLGLINACVDLLTQEPSYPEMAYNNTYGLKTINKTIYDQSIHDFEKKGGCKDQILKCRELATKLDPGNNGNNDEVNKACRKASDYCGDKVEGSYLYYANRGYYDITHLNPDPFPPNYFIGYLNQYWVQKALGVPINYTISVNSVYDGFTQTGDYARGGFLEDLSYVLDSGIKVAMVYGDRDYACNWIGGEAVSKAVQYSESHQFQAAGYSAVHTNASYVGGVVRQHGNFSFSRVFEAGHEIPAYQPETAYEIFMRAMFNKDISTGSKSTAPCAARGGKHGSCGDYSTGGPDSTFQIKNKVPPQPVQECYVWAPGTCTDAQYATLQDGTAVVENFILVGYVNGTKTAAGGPTAVSSD